MKFSLLPVFFLCLAVTTATAQSSIWNDDVTAATDTTRRHELHIGIGTSIFAGSASLSAFDISSWQTTNGTRLENNANLEARLRTSKGNFSNVAVLPASSFGYSYLLTDKLRLLAELNLASSQDGYAGAFYGGLAYHLHQTDNLRISAFGKLGYGQQVMYHDKLQSIKDSIPRTTGQGKVYNNYGQTVFTRQGTVLDGDRVMLSFSGVQFQIGASADYKLNRTFWLKGQVAYQGAVASLDRVLIDGSKNNRTENGRLQLPNSAEFKVDHPALVKTDLTNSQAGLKATALLSGLFLNVGLGFRF